MYREPCAFCKTIESCWTSGTASKTIIIYFHKMSNKPCKAQIINVAC